MIAAVDIFDEVEVDVTALNEEIVRRAFHGHCCKFFNNQEEFTRLLNLYTYYRLAIRRLRIQERKDYANRSVGYYAQLRHHTELARSRRERVKELWPCAACIWIYNPTHRLRRFPQLA